MGIISLIQTTLEGFGDMGMSLSIAAIGSAIGTGIAGMAAIGAWKKMITSGQKAATALLIFVGAPLSQVIYGMILKNAISDANLSPDSYLWQIIIGLFAGAAMAGSAIFQGKAGARACDAIAAGANDTAKYIMIIGVVETVALFVMIFTMTGLPGS
jgi:V/A-type H+-transporting ATPase subunit K